MSAMLTDTPVLREELKKDIETRQLELVQLLADANVSVDSTSNDAVCLAISRMDLEMLESLRHANFITPISNTLNQVPDSALESGVLQVIDAFGLQGSSEESLGAHLVRAVQKQQLQPARTLLAHGASIEFQQAAAVRAALENGNFDLFSILIQHKCSPSTLSAAIPVAMSMKPRSARLGAMQSLTQKGVPAQELGIPLRTLAAEEGTVDNELIRLILQHEAPVDNIGDESNNAVLVATRRGLVNLLELLCDVGPREKTLSAAIPIALNAVHTYTYEVAFKMMQLLLRKGVTGQQVHQTLLNAAKQDTRLDIVHLLLNSGADANQQSGAAFAIAIEIANLELLQMLCAKCPPTSSSIRSILPLATIPRHFDIQMLGLLLGNTPNVGNVLNTSWSSEQFKGNPNINHIVRCFLHHGMNVDLKNGSLLCFAIQERKSDLLVTILSACPSVTSLIAAFKEATSIHEGHIKLVRMRLLLEAAESTEIGQSAELPQETACALAGDSAIFHLLLAHQADVNFKSGLAIQTAAIAGSSQTLAALLSCRPIESSIHCACLKTVFSTRIGSDQKLDVYKQLLDSKERLTVEGMTDMLADFIQYLPECAQLSELLLVRGAVANLETLEWALVCASQPLFTMLANNTSSFDTLAKLFRYASEVKLDPDRRYWAYKCVLARIVAKDDIFEALLKSLMRENVGDLSLSRLLLENGASVDYKGGMALDLAFELNSFDAVKLLSQHFVDDRVANLAFKLAWRSFSLDKDTRYMVYQCFLDWHIEVSSIDFALVENLADNQLDSDIVELLLRHGADPNKEECRCFIPASSKGAEDQFRALVRYGNPDLGTILNSLLKHFKEEWEVTRWFEICLEECLHSVRIDQDDLLFQCMRTFPGRTRLLKLLLDKGAPPSATLSTRLCPGWEFEMCTVLLWAICSLEPRITNGVILALLSRAGKKALPAYSAPRSKLSAVFACIIDDTRTDVLKALLDVDETGVMEHTMLESKFMYLAAYPNLIDPDPDPGLSENVNELRPRVATLYAGNFEAFHLMRSVDEPNDGTLGIAALLALPRFIQWLLENGHEPNYRHEETNMMIPLALTCSSSYMASCVTANREAGLLSRQKQSMELLAAKTDLSWKYRGRTVLHYALDAGSNVTKAMVEALKVAEDDEKDDKYLYVDRTGIHYSPDQYVERIMKIDDAQEQNALVAVIRQSGMASRYYRDVVPGKGEQSLGYQGLPETLKLLWRDRRPY